MRTLHRDIEKILFTEDEIRARVRELGQEITRDYAQLNEPIIMISVLRGAAIFMADLVREIDLPVEMDYMAISSYGAGVTSSGVVRIVKDITTDIAGKHVIIAEDVLDSGLTLKYTIRNLQARKPASVEVATLLHKKVKSTHFKECRYTGFDIPDEFVVGYGLDYDERYRNFPYIGILKESVYRQNDDQIL